MSPSEFQADQAKHHYLVRALAAGYADLHHTYVALVDSERKLAAHGRPYGQIAIGADPLSLADHLRSQLPA